MERIGGCLSVGDEESGKFACKHFLLEVAQCCNVSFGVHDSSVRIIHKTKIRIASLRVPFGLP